MNAVIRLDVPDWQIGKEVSVYFPDTMMKKGECEKDIVHCKDCKNRTRRICNEIELWECEHIRYKKTKCGVTDDWFCADGELKQQK